MARREPPAAAEPKPVVGDWPWPYIPESFRPFAVEIDSLVIDVEENVRKHEDKDLSAQMESLKSWGFTRLVIARKETRKVVIGNGSVLAAKRLEWTHVPVDFRDLTEAQARALGAADNMLGSLAEWNEKAIEKLIADLPELDLPEFSLDLESLSKDVMGRLIFDEPASVDSTGVVTPPVDGAPAAQMDSRLQAASPSEPADAQQRHITVSLSHGLFVKCKSEQQQITLMSELLNRGFECRVSTTREK